MSALLLGRGVVRLVVGGAESLQDPASAGSEGPLLELELGLAKDGVDTAGAKDLVRSGEVAAGKEDLADVGDLRHLVHGADGGVDLVEAAADHLAVGLAGADVDDDVVAERIALARLEPAALDDTIRHTPVEERVALRDALRVVNLDRDEGPVVHDLLDLGGGVLVDVEGVAPDELPGHRLGHRVVDEALESGDLGVLGLAVGDGGLGGALRGGALFDERVPVVGRGHLRLVRDLEDRVVALLNEAQAREETDGGEDDAGEACDHHAVAEPARGEAREGHEDEAGGDEGEDLAAEGLGALVPLDLHLDLLALGVLDHLDLGDLCDHRRKRGVLVALHDTGGAILVVGEGDLVHDDRGGGAAGRRGRHDAEQGRLERRDLGETPRCCGRLRDGGDRVRHDDVLLAR